LAIEKEAFSGRNAAFQGSNAAFPRGNEAFTVEEETRESGRFHSIMPRQRLHSVRRLMAVRFPRFVRCAKRLKWRIVWPIRRMIIRCIGKASKLHADPYQVYYISPNIMKNTIYGPADVPNPATVSGMVKKGDWDRKTLPVEDLDIVRGARDRFVNGMAWEETEYYRSHLERISKGEQWHGCRNKQDLDKYCSRFDRLYEEIKNNGYKSQSAIRETEYGNTASVEHEITVHFDRDGRLLFCDGRHRLAIVLALGIERIPVKVCIRHAKWQAFCSEILSYAKKHGGKVYQPLTHFDLQSISSAHGDKRFEIIRDHLPLRKGKLLDIGAHWGYFCHRCEELGFDCYAVENAPENVYFLKRLRTAEGKKFRVIAESILTYRERFCFDVVLALNIFHHFLKKQDDYNMLVGFLQRMDMKMMFFEPYRTSEGQMINAYRNYEPDEFVRFILSHSGLNHADLIGEAEDGRPIYKLWK